MSGVSGVTPHATNYGASQLDGPKTLHNTAANNNEVSQSTPSQGAASQADPSTSTPTGGGRETTTSNVPGYAEIERMTQERLEADPEYQKLKAKEAALAQAQLDFATVDGITFLGKDDGIVTIQELRSLAEDPLRDEAIRNAAQRLLNNTALWNELAKNLSDGVVDNKVGTADVMRLIEDTAAKLKGMREETRTDIRGEVGAAVAANAAQAPGAAGGSGASAAAGGSPLFRSPTLSAKPGMEGAVENINNTLQSIGNEIADISMQLTNSKLTPEDRQALQNKYNDLLQLQGMLTNMFKQLQEAIASMIKMYSDVAMNSVRNMK